MQEWPATKWEILKLLTLNSLITTLILLKKGVRDLYPYIASKQLYCLLTSIGSWTVSVLFKTLMSFPMLSSGHNGAILVSSFSSTFNPFILDHVLNHGPVVDASWWHFSASVYINHTLISHLATIIIGILITSTQQSAEAQ